MNDERIMANARGNPVQTTTEREDGLSSSTRFSYCDWSSYCFPYTNDILKPGMGSES